MKTSPRLLSLALVLSLPVLVWQWRVLSKFQRENAALRAQGPQATKEPALFLAASQRAVPDESLDKHVIELNRLRNELALLRREKKQLEGQAEMRKAQALTSATNAAPPPLASADSTASVPKESWTFAGYATPEATLLSMVWALREGDLKTLLATFVPEEQESIRKIWGDKTEDETAAEGMRDMVRVNGFRIVEKKTLGDREVMLQVHAEGDGDPQALHLKRVGNEWKVFDPPSQPAP